jgi:hypothetical protein
MTQKQASNIRLGLSIVIPGLILAAGYGALKQTVLDVIPALRAADATQCQEIERNAEFIVRACNSHAV